MHTRFDQTMDHVANGAFNGTYNAQHRSHGQRDGMSTMEHVSPRDHDQGANGGTYTAIRNHGHRDGMTTTDHTNPRINDQGHRAGPYNSNSGQGSNGATTFHGNGHRDGIAPMDLVNSRANDLVSNGVNFNRGRDYAGDTSSQAATTHMDGNATTITSDLSQGDYETAIPRVRQLATSFMHVKWSLTVQTIFSRWFEAFRS